MSPWAEFGAVFNEFVALSEAAFAAGDYEGAYHMLAAAVQVARDAGDQARLAEADQAAAGQRARLAETAPQHQVADRTPGQPGGPRPYKALETIMAYLQVLGAREHAAEEREARGGGA